MWSNWSGESKHKVASFARVCVFFGFGVSVMVLAELIPHVPTRHVIAELGGAIIVATVAVCAIELRAHDRLIDKIVSQLTTKAEAFHVAQAELTRTEIDKIVRIGQEHFNRLEAVAGRSSRAALPDVLEAVFKNHDPKLHTHTIAMIEALEQMKAKQSWTDHVAMRFVGDLSQYVSINATNLARASKERGGAYDITLPRSSNQLADIILAGQRDQLVEGDSYVVVSDLSSWRNGLSEWASNVRAGHTDAAGSAEQPQPQDRARGRLSSRQRNRLLRASAKRPLADDLFQGRQTRPEDPGEAVGKGPHKLPDRPRSGTLVSRQEIDKTLGANWWKADQEMRRPRA